MTSLGVRLDPIPYISIEDSIGLAQLAESLGYEMIWVPEGGGSDSITRWRPSPPPPAPFGWERASCLFSPARRTYAMTPSG